jgi:hypothetical protein
LALLVYAGPEEAGERAIAPFRALADPIADMVRPMSYPEMFEPIEEEGPDDRAVREAWVREFAATLDQGDAGADVGFVGDEGGGARPAGLPRADRGPAGGGQTPVRSDEPVPDEPEHPADDRAVLSPGRRTSIAKATSR